MVIFASVKLLSCEFGTSGLKKKKSKYIFGKEVTQLEHIFSVALKSDYKVRISQLF